MDTKRSVPRNSAISIRQMFLLSVMSWTPTISFIPGKKDETSLLKLIDEVTARAINYRDTKNDRNQRHLAATTFGPSTSNQKQCFYHSIERQLRRVNSKKRIARALSFSFIFSTIKGSKLCNKYVSTFIHICLFALPLCARQLLFFALQITRFCRSTFVLCWFDN